MKKKKTFAIIALLLIVACIVGVYCFRSEVAVREITKEQAEELIERTFSDMLGTHAQSSMQYLLEHTSVTVDGIDYGSEKDIHLSCTVRTLNVSDILLKHKETLLNVDSKDPATGMDIVSTKLKGKINEVLYPLMETAQETETSCEIVVYDTKEGLEVYTTDEVVDACFGGMITARKEIQQLEHITTEDGEITLHSNIKKGLLECVSLNYSTRKPDAASGLVKQWNNFQYDFRRNFIKDNNWRYITKGLVTTGQITFFALLIGVVLGFIVAIVRCTYQNNIGSVTGLSAFFLKFFNAICKLYLTVLRGTPVLVQLMIIFFVIFMPLGIDKFLAAIICFGLNSGAYVAEIVRGGIMSVDQGQMEAGRSLGFNYWSSMFYIILPQTIKAVLPALANEFIVLLKETSVSAYIGINDLARGGDIIRGVTYSAFMPLIAVALIYLVVVVFLQYLVGILERRLKNNER